MLTRKLAGLAALAMVVSLAACSDEEPGTPSDGGQAPVVPPSSAPVAGLPHSGAPKVDNPIADTSQWEADPCSVISAEQLQSVGLAVPAPERKDQPTGPGCIWEFDAEAQSLFGGGLGTTGGREGISNLYKHQEQGTAAVFEVLPPIDGYPAAVAMEKDDRSEGVCSVGVGLRDDLLYTMTMTADPSTPQGKDPCDWAAKVTALAVQTMKGAS